MEKNHGKFRLRLNLFDGIVLLAALAVGGALLWHTMKPQSAAGEPASASSIQYTVRFLRWPQGNESLIQEGDLLVDNVKNYELGRVVSFQTVPAESLLLDHTKRQYVLAATPGYNDILVTVQGSGSTGGSSILLDGGYELRVGSTAYIRSAGYMASGPIISIQREGQT